MNTMQQLALDIGRVRALVDRSGLTENGRRKRPPNVVRVPPWLDAALTAEQQRELRDMGEYVLRLWKEAHALEKRGRDIPDELIISMAEVEEDLDGLIQEVIEESGVEDETYVSGIGLVEHGTTEETIARIYGAFVDGGWSVKELDDALANYMQLVGGRVTRRKKILRDYARDEWERRYEQRLRPNFGIAGDAARVAGALLTPNAGMRGVARTFRDAVERLEDMGFEEMPDVQLLCDVRAGDGGERQYGYCVQTTDGRVAIAFAPDVSDLPEHNLRGLVYHELGHALEFTYGVRAMEEALGERLPTDVERRADVIAERVFGEVIRYDCNLVQCAGPGCQGTSPRPASLRRR